MNLINEKEYQTFLKEILDLMDLNPAEDSDEAARLKLISMAVQAFEKNKFYFKAPSPIQAIKFRMEEMGLNQNDLAPYLGGKNRSSEILSKKRPLTLAMVKALHKYLEIPLEALLNEEKEPELIFSLEKLAFNNSLIKEIKKKGWVPIEEDNWSNTEIISNFLKPIGGTSPSNILFRKSPRGNIRVIDHTAAFVWSSKVLLEAKKVKAANYSQEKIDSEFLKRIAKISCFEKGPLLVQEELNRYGIKLVIVSHLSSTYIDGAVIPDENGNPVIGISLRYDRLDSFWHTLMHELVHIHKHFKITNAPFLDNMDIEDSNDPIEKEADQLAREIFIPKSIWRTSDVIHLRTTQSITDLANELQIHPAIIAGRIRFETQKYTQFSDFLGANTLRKMFGVK